METMFLSETSKTHKIGFTDWKCRFNAQKERETARKGYFWRVKNSFHDDKRRTTQAM